jgi:hypothetical protein
MQSTTIIPNDALIVGRLIKPEQGDFSVEAARAILNIHFDDADKERMHQLALKAQDGELTPSEQAEIDSYRRVGCVLGVLWSKARLSLKQAGMDADNGHRT